MRRLIRHGSMLVSLACLAALAFASQASGAPAAPPRVAYVRPGTFGPLAIPPGSKYMEVPMGTNGIASGYIPAGAYHVYHCPLYAGQTLEVDLTPASNVWNGWEMDLFNRDIQSDALQSVYGGSTLARINYSAGPVTIGGALQQFDFGYDIVIFAPPHGGSYTMKWQATDPYDANAGILRYAGDNRYMTAYSDTLAFPSISTFVVATGNNFADALAASSLCGSYDAPLVLAEPTRITPQIKTWMDAANPTTILVVGSNKAVSDTILDSLKKTGRTVERIQGTTRFETAAAIARSVHDHELSLGHTPSTDALVVNGLDYPDALSVSPYAFHEKMPVLLVTPTSLPGVTRSVMTSLGVDSAHVIGSASAISKTVMDGLPAANKDRIYGATRVQTSSQVASYAVDAGWADWNNVAVATAYNYPDGLAAGVFAGKLGGTLLLTKPLYMQEETYGALYDHRTTIRKPMSSNVTIWGGKWTVSGFVYGEIDDALSGNPW